MSCFEITKEQCHFELERALNHCLNKVDLPKSISITQDAGLFGAMIGQCAMTRFNQSMIPQRKETKECLDATKWPKQNQ